MGTDGISLGGDKFYVTRTGNLTATSFRISGTITTNSGSIDGWSIDEHGLHSDCIHIKSDGSIQCPESWYINAEGYAELQDVKIKGVRKNSSFGQMYIRDNNQSFYSSWDPQPFKDTCITHIESISATYIKAEYLDAMKATINTINANYITEAYVSSASINVDQLTGGYISVANIDCQGVVDAASINAEKITTALNDYGQGQITVGTVRTATISMWDGYGYNSSAATLDWFSKNFVYKY